MFHDNMTCVRQFPDSLYVFGDVKDTFPNEKRHVLSQFLRRFLVWIFLL